MNALPIYMIVYLSSFFNFYKRWCHTISVVKQCFINNYKNSGKYASLIFVSLYTINIVIPEGLFVFTYRNKKWHDAFISGFHHSLEKDPRGFRNAKTVYTICQLFLLFSADQIMQELLEDSIFGKLLYTLYFRGISHDMIQNCYGFRYFCIGNYLHNREKIITITISSFKVWKDILLMYAVIVISL